MMRNFGYRVKINPDFLKEFFAFYEKCFDSLEIKLTDDLLLAPCMEQIIRISTDYEFKHLSFHAPKKAFYTENDYKLLLLFLDSDNVFAGNFFVTHFYSDIQYKTDYITAIMQKAENKNARILLENVEMGKKLFEYLTQLKQLAIRFNIRVCLDIGHLFYSANKCNVENSELISFFQNDIWWYKNVVEIHMHDFDDAKCHLNIGKGLMNFDDVTRLLAIFETSCPIILETTVSDLRTQGVREHFMLKERIHENENN